LVELSLLMPVLLTITFGIIEGGYILYQQHQAQMATQLGARYAATRPAVVPGLEDCGVTTSADAGTDCIDVAGSTSWSVTCQNGGGAGCDGTAMANVLAEMQRVFPDIDSSNLTIVFSGTGLGFVGRGRPIPAITIRLENLEYNYVALGHLVNLGSVLNLDNAETTTIAEDISDGNA